MPGMRRPPVTAAIFSSATLRELPRASLIAATIRSWSMSTSEGSTADGSMVTETSSCFPVTTALTTPPPAEPSIVIASSSPWMRSISCCICWAIRCRLPIPMVVCLLVSWSSRPESGGLAGRALVGSGSAHLADVDEIVLEDPLRFREDPSGLVVRRRRRNDVDVRRDAADADRAAEESADGGLEVDTLPLGDVLEERLRLREAERHDVAVDRQGTALGDDRARGGSDGRHDLRPAGQEPVEIRARRGWGWRRLGGRRLDGRAGRRAGGFGCGFGRCSDRARGLGFGCRSCRR